ncbi:hypothetical protein A4X09_0g2510 [Tilletia walkeri]|uniref:Uncharacterized protein n=1 Tax=Tilletia walkeri TaxID=117179 RepID=A0A8X7T613_9BASI|nr:hypothetical protein A4X09_0g2510 [Tilletia walkeri]
MTSRNPSVVAASQRGRAQVARQLARTSEQNAQPTKISLPVLQQQREQLPLRRTASPSINPLPLPVPICQPFPIHSTSFPLFAQQEKKSDRHRKQRPRQARSAGASASALAEPSADFASSGSVQVGDSDSQRTNIALDLMQQDVAFDGSGDYYDWPVDVETETHNGDLAMADMATLLFSQKKAYLARIDARTWAVEDIADGVVQVRFE